MKRILFISAFLLILSNTAFSQQKNPVSWESSFERISDTEFYLVFSATIQPGWHLYNLQIPKGGPIATSFTFDKSKSVKFEGGIYTETTPIKAYDNSFSMDLEYFSNKVVFKQKVKISKGKSAKVKGNVRFMSCDDHQCIPPTEFSFEVLIK